MESKPVLLFVFENHSVNHKTDLRGESQSAYQHAIQCCVPTTTLLACWPITSRGGFEQGRQTTSVGNDTSGDPQSVVIERRERFGSSTCAGRAFVALASREAEQ